ncbi:hypothetical protein BC826DRAFT_1184463 [Russula brevipes]|nr:hypothetical protein BC826DRAFT_1184463 [Russula brevipes]
MIGDHLNELLTQLGAQCLLEEIRYLYWPPFHPYRYMLGPPVENPFTYISRWYEDRTHGKQRGDENTIHPTFSSWLRNINALSTLINRLCDLARTAPRDTQPQLHRQVAVLRAGFKKQQERCIAFLQLTEEYADRFLSDISEEIQQQSSFLEALERRLDMAKSLRKQAVELRKSYEVGTLHCIKEVRHTVLSQPLPQETDLFSEMDIILNEIRRCYVEMDKFWVEELRRVTKAFKDRRVDPEDIDRWKNIKESLTQTIAGLEKISTDNDVTPRPNIRPSAQVQDLGPVASSLSDAAKAAHRALKTARLGASAEVFLKPVHYSIMLRAECNLLENRGSCVDFLRECIRYGKTVVMTCVAFVPYSPFSRSRASQDLVDDAARLKTERTEDSSEATVLSRDMRKFNSIYKKSLSSLHEMDRQLETLFSCIGVWVTGLDGYSTFPAFDIKHLQGQSRVWVKKRDDIRNILAALLVPPGGEHNGNSSSLETRT